MAPKPGTPIAYAYASDPEAGSQLPRRLARRLTRRAKIGLSLSVVLVLFFLLSGRPSRHLSGLRPNNGKTRVEGDTWDEGGGNEPGWGWSPFTQDRKPTKTVSGGQSSPRMDDYIAPLHPDLSLLPDAEELFPEISIPQSLHSPKLKPYPQARLREIIDPEHSGAKQGTVEWTMNPDSFYQKWKAPKEWNGQRGEIRRVQWEGFAGGRDRWETEEQKRVRENRRDAVKRGFVYAWQGYKAHAWGEVVAAFGGTS
jgi:mannosyl-oligosaccharide alpha-1,2-mannosidase